MKILMIVSNFYPEIRSSAHLYYDLAMTFNERGHKVSILTSFPRNFNLSLINKNKKVPKKEIMNGIQIIRTKHFDIMDNPLIRGLEHLLIPHLYFKEYKKINEHFDICLIYIPPLPLYKLAKKIKKYDGTPSVLNFQDFHPQELIDVNYGGLKKNLFMIKILKKMEKDSYKTADYIIVLSDGGVKYVVERGANPLKVSRIFNGIKLDMLTNKNFKNFKFKEGIENKFLISYAGVLSTFQGIDNILDVASELRDKKNIIFYIIGSGTKSNDIKKRISREKIFNVKMLPYQTREEYFNILNSSDVSIVSLDERMKAPCLPGKLVNILTFEKPVLGIASKDSETCKFIEKTKCGICVEPGDIENLKNTILKLINNPEMSNSLAKNGFKFLKKNMIIEKNIVAYEKIFSTLIKNN